VESALVEHAAVAVVGKPDPGRGQIVKAFVVLAPGGAGSAGRARADGADGPLRYAGDGS
jgi:acetyl-CoA synthetase